jgi:hypothetical protein
VADIVSAVGDGGGFAALALVLVVLLRQNAVDRKAYRAAADAHGEQMEAQRKRHTATIVELDTERVRRRAIEDEVGVLRDEIRVLKCQMAVLERRTQL